MTRTQPYLAREFQKKELTKKKYNMNTYGCVKKYCIFEISKLHTCIHIEECVIFVQF